MIGLLRKVDDRIQTNFDAVVHFFMRTFGVTKGFVRYALWGGQICRLLMTSAVSMTEGRTGSAVVDVLIALLFFWSQRWDKHHDEQAEKAGALSFADTVHLQFFHSGWKAVWWVFLLAGLSGHFVLTVDSRFDRLHWIAGNVGDVLWLCMEYLRKTPPTPPAKKEQKEWTLSHAKAHT